MSRLARPPARPIPGSPRHSRTWTLSGTALALLASFTPANATASVTADQMYEARDLICEFRSTAAPPLRRWRSRDPAASLLVVIEQITRNRETARVITSHTVGSRQVRFYQGETGLHFVEDRQDSVVVTTLLGCEHWAFKRGRDFCTRYSAINSWHFDTSVHRNADRAFRKLPTSSYKGTCEPWNPNG